MTIHPSELMRSVFFSPEVNSCDKLLCKIYTEDNLERFEKGDTRNHFFKICIDQTSVQKTFKLCFRPSSQRLYGVYTLGIRSSE